MIRKYLLITILACALPAVAFAQEESAEKLASLWTQLVEQQSRENFALVSDLVSQIVVIRDGAGIQELPDYARALIEKGRVLELEGRPDDARLFYRWGLKLAPTSPEILWDLVPLASDYGLGSPLNMARQALMGTISSPFRALSTFQKSIYPILSAFTIALLISFVLMFCAQLMEIFRVLAWRVSPERRGIILPLLALGLFVLPLFMGMLWCLSLWAITLYVLIPEKRFLSLATGIVVFAWGVLVPFSENIAAWLADSQVRRIVLAGEQPLLNSEIAPLKQVIADWQHDPVVQFKFAQLLRRTGERADASKIISHLDAIYGEQSWLSAERGVLSFLAHDAVTAEKELREASEADSNSAEILFNLSKVIFEKNDTKESRDLFGKALKIDKQKIEAIQKREDALGGIDARSFADVDLPLQRYIAAALHPSALSFERAGKRIQRVMPGLEARGVSVIGFLLILMHLLPHRRSRRINPKGLFESYENGRVATAVVRIVPAGYAIIGDQIRGGFLFLSALVFAAMPLINGSYNPGRSLSHVAWMMPYHLCALSLVYLVMMLISVTRSER